MEVESGDVKSEDLLAEETPPVAPEAEAPPEEAPEAPEPVATEPEPETPAADETPEPTPEALTDIQKLEKQVQYLQRKVEKQTQPGMVAPDPIADEDAPKLEDFNTVDDYDAAATTFKIDQQVNAQVRKALERQPEIIVEQERQSFNDNIYKTGATKYNDFAEVVGNPQNPFTVEMVDAVRLGDNENVPPEDVFYYLAKNQAEAVRISRMPPVQVAREIVKIENQLAANKPAVKPIKTISDAPDPIRPTGSGIIITKDPNKMSQAEYEKWRSEGGGT